MTDLNQTGLAHARSLIAAGKVDKTSDWSFTADDGNALLGASGADWTEYSRVHLGVDKSAADKTKARWNYPVAKGGKVYRSGVIAAKDRAGQQGDKAVETAAGDLLEKIDGSAPKGAHSGLIECKAAPFEFKFVDDGSEPEGTFEGYASTFDTEDAGGDLMLPGAFDKTLAQAKASGRMPKMLLNHGGMGGYFASPSPEDMLPIGKWSAMTPDTHGLQAKGRLINLNSEHGGRVYGAMKEGELSDLSIGYIPRDFSYGKKPNEPRRTLKSVDLMEVSPVTFPMNRLATINQVKAAAAFATIDPREMEAALCDAGLSRRDALKAVAVFRQLPLRDAGESGQALCDAATSDEVRGLAARIRASA